MRVPRRSTPRTVGALAAAAALPLALAAVALGEGHDAVGDTHAVSVEQVRDAHAAAPRARPRVLRALRHDRSRPLREIAPSFPPGGLKEAPENPRRKAEFALPGGFDPSLQTTAPQAVMPPISRSFDGVSNVNAVLPPDTNADVGRTQIVETVNLSFAVYSKTGARLYGPAATNTLFSGFGGPCESTDDGDPIVQYDQLADRWLISQFALPSYPRGPFYQCLAVSTSDDATGSYYRYEFLISDATQNLLNDYPKFGVWPDGYYMAVNDFRGGSLFTGVTVVAFDRSKLLAGVSAQAVEFVLANPSLYSLLPSDLDGRTQPAPGTPNSFLQVDDDAQGYPRDQLEVWNFHVDWTAPSSSTFTQATPIPVASFDSDIALGIPQPGTVARLDPISDRLMYRLAYRNFGSYEDLVVNHTVDVGGLNRAGIRWYELRRPPGGQWNVYQQGTYAPDDKDRWMASAAMDASGDIALGFSFGNGTVRPSIRYAGRLASDPLGLITGEGSIQVGTGSQTDVSGRWGDYTSMVVDPTDDCTFWYSNEYLSTTGPAPWRTRIASFRFPTCTSAPSTAPAVTSFAPDHGPVGAAVTIAGVNLTGATAVQFDGVAAAYTVDSATQITARVPAGAGSGPITVTTPSGTATSTSPFTVDGAPAIGGFSPASGPPGTLVTVAGTGFTGATAVTFNGTAAASYAVVSDTQITATVPAGATTGPIAVTTPLGSATSSTSFTVTAAAQPPVVRGYIPNRGRAGSLVTIFGTGFVHVQSVTLRGVAAEFTVTSPTIIRATVPSVGKGVAHWQVTTAGGTGTGPAFTVW